MTIYDYDDLDCELCQPSDGSEPYPYAHCCLCGDTGAGDVPDCECEWE
jgi:hypothetical protein